MVKKPSPTKLFKEEMAEIKREFKKDSENANRKFKEDWSKNPRKTEGKHSKSFLEGQREINREFKDGIKDVRAKTGRGESDASWLAKFGRMTGELILLLVSAPIFLILAIVAVFVGAGILDWLGLI